jgi:cation diffusion facilitator family transporter
MTTDLAILLGVKYWTAPADEQHPYGHHRIETMITVFIGLALLAVALGLSYNAIITIRDKDVRQPGAIALAATIISIISKEILFRWTIKIGQQAKSTAVTANAWHHRSDAFSSIPAMIAVGLALIYPNLAFVDHIGALVVSIFIFIVGWNISSQALNVLADRSAPETDTQKIYEIAMGIEHVLAVHAIRTRQLGSSLHVDLHVKVDPNMRVKAGHDVSEIVKHELIARGPNVIDVVVHLEPFEG